MNAGTLAGIIAIVVSGAAFAAVLSALMLSGRISRKDRSGM